MRIALIVLAGTLAAGFCIAGYAAAADREAFQVTFGVRPALQQSGGVTDRVSFIVEAANGDIVVAGYGASSYTDTGNRTKPMIARIDRAGNVHWRRIYDDLGNHEILAFAGKGDEQFVVFRQTIEASLGLLQDTETVTLRRVDPEGSMSGILGRIEGVRVHDVTAVVGTELERFVVAGSDARGMTYSRPEQRDVHMHEIDIHGNVRRIRLQEGVKGLQHLQHIRDGNFLFLRTKGWYGEPQDIARMNGDGEIEPIVVWQDPMNYPLKIIATRNRLFIIGAFDYRAKINRIAAHTMDGSELWHYDFEGVGRVASATLARSGGLILSGSYEGNPVLYAVDSRGDFHWSRRFRSARKDAAIAAIIELSDGWLALAGSTSPGSAAYSSTDSDALLAVSGPAGAGLEDYGKCLANADEIERLRAELLSLTGIEVRRETFMSGREPTPIEDLPPLNTKVPADIDCGTLSEHALLRFLRESVDEANELKLPKASDPAKIDVLLRPTASLAPNGFREMGRIAHGQTPRLHVEHSSAREATRYIAVEILPYTERLGVVTDRLRAAGRMWVGDKQYGTGAPGEPSYSEVTEMAEQFVDLLSALPDQDRRAFTTKFTARPIVFSPDEDLLHVWGDRWILVGRNRIDDIFNYALETFPALQEDIALATNRIRSKVAVEMRKRDPGLVHADYLKALRRVAASIEDLSDQDIAVLRNTFATVEVGRRYSNDLGMHGYRRRVYMATVAAEHVLSFIVENATVLQSQ